LFKILIIDLNLNLMNDDKSQWSLNYLTLGSLAPIQAIYKPAWIFVHPKPNAFRVDTMSISHIEPHFWPRYGCKRNIGLKWPVACPLSTVRCPLPDFFTADTTDSNWPVALGRWRLCNPKC